MSFHILQWDTILHLVISSSNKNYVADTYLYCALVILLLLIIVVFALLLFITKVIIVILSLSTAFNYKSKNSNKS